MGRLSYHWTSASSIARRRITRPWISCRMSGSGQYRIDPSGELEVERRETTGIVRCDRDGDAVVDVRPIGMMIEAFSHQRHLRHETERLHEVFENQFTAQRCTVELPTIERFDEAS